MIKIIITLIATILLMFLTSWVLDWWFIQEHWIRQGIVYLLVLFELVLGTLIVRQILKTK